MKVHNPCKDCEKRTVGCHAACEEYKEYKTKRQAERDARMKYIYTDWQLTVANYERAANEQRRVRGTTEGERI